MQTAVEITLTQEELLATLRRLRILCRTFIVYRYPSCDPDKDIWGLTTEEEKERKELLAKLPHPANFRVHSSLDPPHERDEYEDWPLPYGLTLVFFRMLLERCGCQNCAPREEKWLIVQKQ
ncbi:MAG: hypothetical protein UY53_C0014G0003 [Parcubacteria group bacterium GW2011_GWA2_50_10]|nr:MAG: hypothetical protein UY38_C0005G0002 [Parcubacteria group bacterium GW2011_GWB1_49_12]KKW08245.1 MAG: hypothetical protein UY45_C0011G0002 [Parcubacteria group bacterium GW2011_GWA1_49_26]KKW13377.1 MAG: hypothetical protein UY53_C0014G0003 [Parcubacteria group bacterium GW2011_GWA2_50_10]